ncbi:MAG: hypothetical protein HKO57_09975, partial [Akkermansiaceae bacterium]|nr:hypothetical protein [Akkermansiaceae bacterium]
GTATSATAALTVNGVGSFAWGGLWRDVFTGIGGSTASDLVAAPNYPNFPDASGVITNAESPSSYGDNYGQRWSGWITPPETGNYRFYLATDDGSQLWLSTTAMRADRVLRAEKFGWTTERNYSGAATSAQIAMVGGQRYYFEVLHKEGGGGDNAALTWDWLSPGVWGTPANGSDPLPGAVLEYQVGGTLDDNVAPPDNYPPVAHEQFIVVYGGAATAVTLTGEDFETSSLSFTVTANPAKGVLSGTAPNLTYTPNGGATGSDQFTFTVHDGSLDSPEATVTLSLVPQSGGDLKVWDGSESDTWPTGGNWVGGTAPDANDAVIFNASSTGNLSTTLGGNRTIANLIVEDPAGPLGIAEDTLTITGGVEMRPAAEDLTIASAVVLGGSQEWCAADGRTLVVSGGISGSGILTKTGGGTLSMRAVSSRNEETVVANGTLELDGGGWYAGYVGGSGMLTIREGGTAVNMQAHSFGSSNNANRDITLDGGRFRLRRETYVDDIFMTAGTIDHVPGGSGDLRARSGSSTVLTVLASDEPSVIATPFNFVGSAVINVEDGAADPDLLVSGALTGGSACTKDGDGRMTLSGLCTHSGPLTIMLGNVAVTGSLAASSAVTVEGGSTLEGTGQIQGSVSNDGLVAPGVDGVAVLTVGSFVQSAAASTAMELAGPTVGSGHDQLAVTGAATLAGGLDVVLSPGFTPEVGDAFLVLTCGSRTGTFDTINLPPLPADREWVTTYDPAGSPGLEASVVAVSPYAQWQAIWFGAEAGNPAISGETADPDADFIENLLEYALNLNPVDGPPNAAGGPYGGLPVSEMDGDEFVFIYRRNLSATDVTYEVEESDDIGVTDPWSPAAVTESIISDDGQTRVIRASLPATAPAKFVRLKVTK